MPPVTCYVSHEYCDTVVTGLAASHMLCHAVMLFSNRFILLGTYLLPELVRGEVGADSGLVSLILTDVEYKQH